MNYKGGVEAATLVQLDLLGRPPLLPVLAKAVHLGGVPAAVHVPAEEEHLVLP